MQYVSAQEKLLRSVSEGKVTINFVISMPRTRSTALHLALSQSPDINGQICHPMNNGIFAKSQLSDFKFNDFRDGLVDISLDEVALRINKVVEPLIEKDGKANIIINEHAKFISIEHLPVLLQLSRTFIFSIRHPKIQFLSHMLRCINECFLTENSKDNKHCFDVEDLLALLLMHRKSEKDLSRKLQDIIDQKPIDIFRGDLWHRYTGGRESLPDASAVKVFTRLVNFVLKEIEATWNNTGHTLDYLLKSGRNITVISVDSEVFVRHPVSVIQHVTSKVQGIGFAEEMITNWRTETRDKFVCFIYTKEEEKDNAWSGPAINSTGVTDVNDSTRGLMLDLNKVPEALATLLVKAEKIYETLLSHSNLD